MSTSVFLVLFYSSICLLTLNLLVLSIYSECGNHEFILADVSVSHFMPINFSILYFETLLLSSYIFRIFISFWLIYPFITMKCSCLSLIILFILILFCLIINIAMLVFSWFVYECYVFFNPSTFKSISLYLNCLL